MQLCHGCAIVVRVTYTDSTPCSQVLLGARTGALTATHDGNFSWGLGTSPIRTHSPDLTNAVVQDETSYTYKLCSVGPSEPAVLMPSHAESCRVGILLGCCRNILCAKRHRCRTPAETQSFTCGIQMSFNCLLPAARL